jgi:hypothetical protein
MDFEETEVMNDFAGEAQEQFNRLTEESVFKGIGAVHFPIECIYGFCVILRINTDHFYTKY